MSSKEAAEKIAGDLASKYNVKTVVIQGVRSFYPRLSVDLDCTDIFFGVDLGRWKAV
jgi:hypothetical protein